MKDKYGREVCASSSSGGFRLVVAGQQIGDELPAAAGPTALAEFLRGAINSGAITVHAGVRHWLISYEHSDFADGRRCIENAVTDQTPVAWLLAQAGRREAVRLINAVEINAEEYAALEPMFKQEHCVAAAWATR